MMENLARSMPDFTLERQWVRRGAARIAGIDEAGRGPWAGPVVAAAVCLPMETLPAALQSGLDDSKKLTPARREALFDALQACAEIGVGRAGVEEIDALNILQASLLAMRRAVAALGMPPPAAALVDGRQDPELDCPVETVIKGDGRSLSIAAASIVAKVTRDREMAALALRHPGYGWERNQGYGTAEHQRALATLGPCAEHRRSFRPISQLVGSTL